MLRLVWRNLLAHPVRSLLTLASMVLAIFLLCALDAANRGLSRAVDLASANRLWVQSAVSLFVELPLSYESRIASVPGVDYVCKWQWFGGVYRDESGFVAQFAVDPETFGPSYPEMVITEGSYEEFARHRTGCIIGQDLAEDYGFALGDTVPIMGTIFPRADGSAWEFTVKAIYRSTSSAFDQQTMFFHWKYLEESLEAGEALGPEGTGVYMIKLAPDADATRVMADVDQMFENGPQRVQTTTEAEFQRQFVSMLGNVPALLNLIGGAVLFAIFFAVTNTMLMAARERTRDLGVMKALGFSDGAVAATLLSESLLLSAAGGGLGLGVVLLSESFLQKMVARFLPGFEFDSTTLALGVGITFAVGLLAGLAPSLRARRLEPVEALREAA